MDNNVSTYTKTFSIDVERANYHHKCNMRRRKRLIVILIIWILIFIYFFTPLSRINLKIYGNVYYSKEEIMNMTYMNKNDYWWLIDTRKAEKVLNSYKHIDGAVFKKSFFGVKLEINEIYPIAEKDNKYVMSNLHIVEKEDYELNEKVGNLITFDNIIDDDFEYLVNKYKLIDLKTRKHFSKIEIIRDSNSYRYVKLYGYDDKIGYFVMKADLVYLNTKFNENKYDKIIEEASKNNVKYSKENPALIAYHYLNEEEFKLVDVFEEE